MEDCPRAGMWGISMISSTSMQTPSAAASLLKPYL